MKDDAVPLQPNQLEALKATGKRVLALGRVTATPAGLAHLAAHAIYPAALLSRHQHGDWGSVSQVDSKRNDQALSDGSRVISVYLVEGKKILAITEAEGSDGVRASTTLLLADEY